MRYAGLDAMRLKGLVWLGIPAGDYAAAVRFFGETPGLEVAFDEGDTVELAAENDLDQARAELLRGGTELLGEPESDGAWT